MVSHPKKQTDRKEVAVEGLRLRAGRVVSLCAPWSSARFWDSVDSAGDCVLGSWGRAGDKHSKGKSDVVTHTLILTHRRQRHAELCEFQASRGYIMSPCLKGNGREGCRATEGERSCVSWLPGSGKGTVVIVHKNRIQSETF